MLAKALGTDTVNMRHGHHGAGYSVKELASGLVAITSINHGFSVGRGILTDDAADICV